MWKIILELTVVFLILVLITQVIIPLAFSGKLFWLFRKTDLEIQEKESCDTKRSFDEEIEFTANKKAKNEEARQKIEDDIKNKINKVNNLNNN